MDVPGHDRLIGNMLVGAGEIDAVLLVVAADDGPRAQTLEHLALLDGLGIDMGLVALTKVDAVEPERVIEVEGLISALLRGTSLAGSPIIPVSAIDGRGMPELSAALVDLRDRVLARADGGRPAGQRPDRPVRFAIDRSFVIKGRGAVVTGSLRGGRLERGALLRLVPGDRQVRARELQVHGSAVDALEGGGRVAINLAAIEAAELPRGAVLTTDPGVVASAALIAIVGSSRPGEGSAGVDKGASFRLHLGTAQVQATVGRGRADLVALPDGRQVARLRLGSPIAVAAGDRFVLRRGGPTGTVTGGQVVDPEPPVGPSRRRVAADKLAALATTEPLAQARALIAGHGVIDPGRLPADPSCGADERTAKGTDGELGAVALGGLLVAAPIAAALQAEAIDAVAARAGAASAAGLSLAELRVRLVRLLRRLATVDERHAGGIVDALLAGLVADRRLERVGDRIHVPGRSAELPPTLLAAMDRLERWLAVPAPPSLAEAARASGCPPDGVRALEAAGRIVRLDGDLAYAAGTYRELANAALAMARTGALAPAMYRDATGTSRKYVLAILEDLDRRGILQRTPTGHVPGPRAGDGRRDRRERAMTRSGIVLAGGASRRFGGDKLAEPIDGVALLDRSIEALAGLVDEIIVVVAPDRPASSPDRVRAAAGAIPFRVVADPEPFGGPLVGLRTGLQAALEGDRDRRRRRHAVDAPGCPGVAPGPAARRARRPGRRAPPAARAASIGPPPCSPPRPFWRPVSDAFGGCWRTSARRSCPGPTGRPTTPMA